MPTKLPEDLPPDIVYESCNHQYFQGALPPCRIEWSRQLTRSAGNIDVKRRILKLSIPLLIEAFQDGAGHEVAGVWCEDNEIALREILKHEMIHLWLHERGLPYGHTAEFRRKAREIGQAQTRHAIAVPLPTSGWIYQCKLCKAQIVRRKRFSAPRACAACCKRFNGGKFDKRFQLRGTRIAP